MHFILSTWILLWKISAASPSNLKNTTKSKISHVWRVRIVSLGNSMLIKEILHQPQRTIRMLSWCNCELYNFHRASLLCYYFTKMIENFLIIMFTVWPSESSLYIDAELCRIKKASTILLSFILLSLKLMETCNGWGFGVIPTYQHSWLVVAVFKKSVPLLILMSLAISSVINWCSLIIKSYIQLISSTFWIVDDLLKFTYF